MTTQLADYSHAAHWPSLLDRQGARQLIARTHESARTVSERGAFGAVLLRCFQEVRELGLLYAELPGVFSGDAKSVRAFRELLDASAVHAPGPKDNEPDGRGEEDLSPCQLVAREAVLLLLDGAARIASEDGEAHQAYVNTIRGLWARTKPREDLLRGRDRAPL